MAECFHCSASNPVGVCVRCNVLACPVDGVRPGQFECVSCGSATAAAGAVAHSDASDLNNLARAILVAGRSAARSEEELAAVTPAQMMAWGLSVRSDATDEPVVLRGSALLARAAALSLEIDLALADERFFEARADVVSERLPDAVLRDIGLSSSGQAVAAAGELWQHLDPASRDTFSIALLVHRATNPATWPLALTVARYGLEPNPASLPVQPWD